MLSFSGTMRPGFRPHVERPLLAGTSSSRTGQGADIDRQNHLAGVIKVCLSIRCRRELGRPESVLLAIDRTAALGSDFSLLRDFQGVIHFDAKVAHGGFQPMS